MILHRERAETACAVFNAYYARKRIAGFLSIYRQFVDRQFIGGKGSRGSCGIKHDCFNRTVFYFGS